VIRPGPSFARNPLPESLFALLPGDEERTVDRASSRVESDFDMNSCVWL